MPSWMIVSLLFLCPMAFGSCASLIMYVLFDVGVFNQRAPESSGNLKRAFTILTWFFANGASVIGTLFIVDFSTNLAVTQANGIAFLGYLLGFGVVGTLLGSRTLYYSIHLRIGKLHPDLTNIETRTVILILHYGIDAPMAALILGIDVKLVDNIYKSACKKMSNRSSGL